MLDSLTLVTCYLVKWRANIASAISRLLQDKMEELISVKDFGAVGDGVTDDHLAIQAAIDHAETLPQVDVFPYAPVKLLFPAGVYRHTKPFRVTKPIQLVGDGVQIKAMAPYSTIPIDKQGGGVTNFSGQFAVVSGKIGANTLEGTLRWGFSICRGIMLDAADTAMSNMYIERFANAVIDSPMQSSPTDGLVVGPSCWGLSSHSLSIENFNRYAIHFLKDAAVNGGKLDLRIWGNFKTGQAGLLFDADSACNGVNITGYIEKVDYGVIAAKSTGAISFDGVDFEQCTVRVLQAAS
ncbi:MAG: glycosyl hydrolase family 28-related protein, partial [Shewanella oncorhynchi]